ncbi:hypothetical protein GQ43DRAFT_473345 [Delitschia confertaspora ATCC 74209]|uniref:Uncharacterized protein n=1 Tax=Delitschia confertaspora ATCC 74209 TaxID=1513339 RepID=A0A9P4JHY3_9PLEO|nr:hypothetical protein GQ43DRAFT_473345 [Delitschia confertaspora ATCC 74209]
MSALRLFSTRLPITAGKRFNSTTSSSRTAAAAGAKVMEMAAAAQKPSAFEAAVPVMWVLTGAMGLMAWNRTEKREGDYVEKLLII